MIHVPGANNTNNDILEVNGLASQRYQVISSTSKSLGTSLVAIEVGITSKRGILLTGKEFPQFCFLLPPSHLLYL